MAHPGTGPDLTGFQHALVDVHGDYRSKRLGHGPPDELISDVVTARTLRPHLVRSGFFFLLLVVVSIISFFTWLIALAVAFAESNSITGAGGGSGFVVAMAYLLLVVQFIVLVAWAVALFLPLREPIAEYGLLIEGRAAAYRTSYWWIMNAMHGRQSPFTVQYAKVQGVAIMLLANGREHGLVVVRPVGTDLYVGWTMWRARSTVVMIGHLFRDMFQSGLAGDVGAASSRALRELIHSVTREGVQAAIVQPVSDEVARAQVDQLPSLDLETGPMPATGDYQQVQQQASQPTQQYAYQQQPAQQQPAQQQPAQQQAAQQQWASQPAQQGYPQQSSWASAPAPTPTSGAPTSMASEPASEPTSEAKKDDTPEPRPSTMD